MPGGFLFLRRRNLAAARNLVVSVRLLNVRSLLALRALHDIEGYLFTFLERLEARHADRREMREQVFAAVVRSDETETLGVVEPLDSTSCHIKPCLKQISKTKMRQPATYIRYLRYMPTTAGSCLNTLVRPEPARANAVTNTDALYAFT